MEIRFDNRKYLYPRATSQLPPLNSDEIMDSDLIEVSHSILQKDASGEDITKYSSRKLSLSGLAHYNETAILKAMKDIEFPYSDYEAAERKADAFSFLSARAVYRSFLRDNSNEPAQDRHRDDITCLNEVTFRENPRIHGTITNLTAEDNADKALNLRTAQGMFAYVSPFFVDKDSRFFSKEMNLENAYIEEITEAPTTESEKHNRYLFRMVGYHSVNTWTSPEAGIFTCWGWVDMRADAYAGSNCNAWVALEGKIGGKWCILQVQPFDKHNGKQLSYVGFTFPVAKGLELRLTSGFRVGTNSNKYQSANGSLANHIANCFVGGVYKAMVGNQTIPDTSRDESNPEDDMLYSSREAGSFDFHEDEIPDKKKATVAELKAKLNSVIAQLNKIAGKQLEAPVEIEAEDEE